MGIAVLRGISTALLITVLTLVAGILWSSTGLGVVTVSQLVDIGLLASCLIGGYRTGKETSNWIFGTLVGAGFVTIGSLLLALFTPVRRIGFLQVLIIGALLGSVAGAFGAGSLNRKVSYSSGTRRPPSYNSRSKNYDWQTVDEDEWTKVNDVPSKVTSIPTINELKYNLEEDDGGYVESYLKLNSFESPPSPNRDEEAKRYRGQLSQVSQVSQSSSPWWEEDYKSMHNA